MKGIWIAPFVIAGAGCLSQDVDDSSTTDGITSDLDRHHDDHDCTWDQWGQNAAHDGSSCTRGQRLEHVFAEVNFDPFVAQESAEGGGALFVHYQAPLTDADGNVFQMQKTGTYLPCDPPGIFDPSCGTFNPQLGEHWTERGYRWHGDRLEPTWTFDSDWRPFPDQFFEPMFQPAVSDDRIYIPGAGGTVFEVNKRTGKKVRRINPFSFVDPNTYLAGGVTVDRDGNLYWNVIHHNPETFSDHGELVKVWRNGRIRTFSYDNVPGAPDPHDSCFATFYVQETPPELPLPPPNQPDGSPTLPPAFYCGSQRPGANMIPTIARDGTIYTGSFATYLPFYSFIVALTPDLKPKWATSLRDRVADGCGVNIPYGTNPQDCREGTPLGFDPAFNSLPPLWISDSSSSAPVALPDGGVAYGALANTNGGRGHLVKLDHDGNFLGTYDFGWDITPAVYEHDHTYSLILKDNFYATGGPYYITQLSANLEREWWYANESTQSCKRNPDGTITCSDTSPDGEEHPDGFEWCVNAPAVDKDGVVYALSEDGNVYSIKQGGTVLDKLFQEESIGAAYTPVSLDGQGRVYALNNGTMRVVGDDRHRHHGP